MRTLMEIGEVANVDALRREGAGREAPPHGHGPSRLRAGDPRAAILKGMAEEACRQSGQFKWYEMAVKLHDRISKAKGLIPNVDFYSAPLFYSLGIPVDLFTPVIAAGPHRRLDGEHHRAARRQPPDPPPRRLRRRQGAPLGREREALSDGAKPHPQAHRSSPRLRPRGRRRRDRHRRRSGAAHRHQRHAGVAAVRGARVPARGAGAGGDLHRSSGLPDRLAQHRRPPLSADGLAQVRRDVLQARQRHLPPGAHGVVLGSRADAAGHRQPHAAVRRGRHAGDRRRRPGRGGGDGRRPVLLPDAGGRARVAHRRAAAVGHRQGRHPRAAAAAHRARR